MASWSLDDTIVAIASPVDAAWRGIIRLSGVDVSLTLAAAFPDLDFGLEVKSKQVSTPAGQCANRGTRTTARVIPAELILTDSLRLPGRLWYWPDCRSFTGQASAEFHTLGSPALLQLGVEQLVASGARLARAGEFTLRAFLYGRLDLVQAEAVLGVVQSQSAAQFREALKQLAGGIHGPFQQMRTVLLNLLADIEAGLDFVEDDIEFIDRSSVLQIIEQQLETSRYWILQLQRRHFWDGAIRIALCGLPNVGKSSLFNALLDRSQAIVSNRAGTTTDFLVGQTQYDGWRLEFVDTAGWLRSKMPSMGLGDSIEIAAGKNLESPLDSVSREELDSNVDSQSQEQMQRQWEMADVRLLCIDLSRQLTPLEEEWLQHASPDPRTIVVGTKCDLEPKTKLPGLICRTSTFSGEGVRDLMMAILANFGQRHQNDQIHLLSTTAMRCGDNLRATEQCLERARQLTISGDPEELVALEIRQALDELGQIIGTVYTDDLLDRIFSRFCIGK